MLLYLMSEQYDMVILGAGINGVAIAKALAHLGKKVLHVYGGKLTSFPSLARKVLKVLDLI